MNFGATLLACLSIFHRPIPELGACTGGEKRIVGDHSLSENNFCITQATLFRPKLMLDLANGSCLLICGEWSSNLSPAPLYRLVDPRIILPLVRISSKILPIDFIVSAAENPFYSDAFEKYSSYKSPLLNVFPNPFSKVHLTLWDEDGISVNITFKTTNDSIHDLTWFAKDLVYNSQPWYATAFTDLTVHFRANQTFKSLLGDVECQFYIGKLGLPKSTMFPDEYDFLMSTAQTAQTFPGNDKYFVWKDSMHSGNIHTCKEFRLYGTLQSLMTTRIYHRV